MMRPAENSALDDEDLSSLDAQDGIDVTDMDLVVATAQATAALERYNQPPRLFTCGGNAVRLEQTDAGPVLRPLTTERARHELARATAWVKRKQGASASVAPPLEVVSDILAAERLPFPTLDRITEVPIFARNRLVTAPGYDAEGRVYYQPQPGFGVPPVSPRPSDEDIQRALDMLLRELLVDFPWVGPAEEANALALILAPFVRGTFEGPTPLHLIEKPAPGTGGTMLANVCSWLTTGRDAPVMTEGRDEDEWRKRITATLMQTPMAVLIDNVRRRLDSASLAGVITSTTWCDRILGRSENVQLPVRCSWVATGNNPALSNEMARRSVRIRLDAKTDRPWQRDGFRHADLRQWTIQHRGELVWAVLTVAQAWVAAGKPRGSVNLGMFEGWARTMSGILEIVGVAGFLANSEELYEAADAEAGAWRALVAAWWEKHSGNEVGVADLWRILSGDDGESIGIELGRGNERSQRTRLGLLLNQQRDRQFGDHRIAVARVRQRAQQWKLVKCR